MSLSELAVGLADAGLRTTMPSTSGTRDVPSDDDAKAPLSVVSDTDVGTTIANRYRVTRVIGEGGMGVVYEAFDRQVERQVAIKLVRRGSLSDAKYMTRFRRELEVTASLRHPSTVRVFEHGETKDGRPYMVMELLTGRCLADVLEEGRIDELQALQFARQIAESLSEAHDRGIFHRDLKPDNIYIETVGVTTVIKVLDFGIAGGIDANRLTRAGEVFGTPQYMSPEQCNGQALDHRTDIYSLGCVLYEMLEGDPPFRAEEPMATMLKHVRAKVPMPKHCSRETARVLLLALRKDRNKRIQKAGRFAELIGGCIGAVRDREMGVEPNLPPELAAEATDRHTVTGRTTAEEPVAAPETTRWLSTGPGRLAGAGLGLAFIGVLGYLFLAKPEPEESVAKAATTVNKPHEDRSDSGVAIDKLPRNRALIVTNVDKAKVHLDDVEQCETPCHIEVPVGDGVAHELRLTKAGYVEVIQRWQPKSVTEDPPELPDLRLSEQGTAKPGQ
ncbi:MAG: PEGA domain-containing protein [Myxococcales bacterium FL481]|nr:MAG: PEGA domain-containing protein [Myxococcales bacterium FL481]